MDAALECNADAVAGYAGCGGWARVKTILERPVLAILKGNAFWDFDPDQSGIEEVRLGFGTNRSKVANPSGI